MKAIKFTLGAMLCASTLTPALAQAGKEVVSNGVKYLDTPYVANTLESDDPEDLIINCDEMDCTTFVEYVLAESLTPKLPNGDISESDFADILRKLRYRDGKINGYASRLHYISEWILNGVKYGFIDDITASNSTDVKQLALNYMTTHPEQYRQLKNSPENVAKMKQVEQSLNGKYTHYLPKDKLPNDGLPWIKEGDIIAITTNVPGLDVAHMGIAFYADGKLTLLHASQKEGKVVVSPIALAQMLKDNERWTGIRVLRIKR